MGYPHPKHPKARGGASEPVTSSASIAADDVGSRSRFW